MEAFTTGQLNEVRHTVTDLKAPPPTPRQLEEVWYTVTEMKEALHRLQLKEATCTATVMEEALTLLQLQEPGRTEAGTTKALILGLPEAAGLHSDPHAGGMHSRAAEGVQEASTPVQLKVGRPADASLLG